MEILEFFQRLWKQIKIAWLALQPAKFSIIVLLAGYFYLNVVPQGKDALLGLSEFKFIKLVLFVVFSILWATQIWYWAKIVYILRYKDTCNQNTPVWIKREMPRVLGVFAFFGIAISMFSMQSFASNAVLAYMGFFFILLAVAFYVFTRYRKKLFNAKSTEHALEDKMREGLPIRFSDFSSKTRATLIISTLLSLVPFFLIVIDPQTFTYKGGVTLIILCFSLWVPIGSWILYFSYRVKLPVFTLLIGLFIIFSLWNDNHHVRVLPGKPQQVSLTQRVDDFLKGYPLAEPGTRVDENATGDVQPLYLVATSGGGIRAAYWTAVILGGLQDKHPEFSKQLFSISAVSGGSLGAAVFAGLIKEQHAGRNSSVFMDAGKVLSADFLSPTVGMMLTGDLLQRALFWPMPQLSRALALEQSFEKGWRKAIGSKQFELPMHKLWEGEEKGKWVPSLFLNGTRVESGLRIITSNILIDNHFVEATNFYNLSEGYQDVPLSTAVDNSCRFPYVSPGGTLTDGTHIVDGGYFDNSGASTTIEILVTILDALKKTPRKVRIIGIVITNDPNPKVVKPLVWLSGLLTPVMTLLDVWSSHDEYYISQFKRMVQGAGGGYVHFVPAKGRLSLPLGWTLSEQVRDVLDKQADKATNIAWPPTDTDLADTWEKKQ